MSTPTQDIMALVRLLLLEDSAVYEKVGERITGPQPARSGTEEDDQLYPRLIVEFAGGETMASGALQMPFVHVYAYSRTSQAEALAIFDTVRPVLRHARLARDGISVKGSIRETRAPDIGYNPQVSAWYVRGNFRATATNLQAP